MRKSILFALILTLISCSAKKLPPLSLNESSFNNTLIRKGCSISLPDDYIFFLKKNEIRNVVTRFKGGEVSGIVEILHYSYPMINEKLAEYYADRVIEKALKRTIRKVSSKRDIYIISAESEDGKRSMETALWLIEEKKLFILQMVADKGFFIKNNRLMPDIISGWKQADKDISLRNKKGLPLFRSDSKEFIWYNDLKRKDGFRIYQRKSKTRFLVSKIDDDEKGEKLKLNHTEKIKVANKFKVFERRINKSGLSIFEIHMDGYKVSFKPENISKVTDFNNYITEISDDLSKCLGLKG